MTAFTFLLSAIATLALAQGPVNAPVYQQADALYQQRDQAGAADKARALLEESLKESPLDAGLLWRYGRARVVTGERAKGWGRNEHFVEAEQSLQAAIDIDPDLVDARYWLSMARFRRGRWHEALSALDAALALSPDDARLHELAGDIRWHAPSFSGGDRKLAVQEYEKALALSGQYASDYVSLAEAYLDLGRAKDAAGILDRLERLPAPAHDLAAADRQRLDALRKRLSR